MGRGRGGRGAPDGEHAEHHRPVHHRHRHASAPVRQVHRRRCRPAVRAGPFGSAVAARRRRARTSELRLCLQECVRASRTGRARTAHKTRTPHARHAISTPRPRPPPALPRRTRAGLCKRSRPNLSTYIYSALRNPKAVQAQQTSCGRRDSLGARRWPK